MKTHINKVTIYSLLFSLISCQQQSSKDNWEYENNYSPTYDSPSDMNQKLKDQHSEFLEREEREEKKLLMCKNKYKSYSEFTWPMPRS